MVGGWWGSQVGRAQALLLSPYTAAGMVTHTRARNWVCYSGGTAACVGPRNAMCTGGCAAARSAPTRARPCTSGQCLAGELSCPATVATQREHGPIPRSPCAPQPVRSTCDDASGRGRVETGKPPLLHGGCPLQLWCAPRTWQGVAPPPSAALGSADLHVRPAPKRSRLARSAASCCAIIPTPL